jgi:hypothetical protein
LDFGAGWPCDFQRGCIRRIGGLSFIQINRELDRNEMFYFQYFHNFPVV